MDNPRDAREPNPEEGQAIDYLVDTGVCNYGEAFSRVMGNYIAPSPEGEAPSCRDSRGTSTRRYKRRPSGHVRNYDGRADEYRGGPGAPAKGYEGIYKKGIAMVRAALEASKQNSTMSSKEQQATEEVSSVTLEQQATEEASSVTLEQQTTEEASPITSEQKMMIIQEKAGFAPSTHDEKNTAVGLIFSANERDKDWVHSYFMETYDHLVKQYIGTGLTLNTAEENAKEGVVSRINEIGDYLLDAFNEGSALRWLQSELDETTNPNLTLSEMILDPFNKSETGKSDRNKDDQTVLWAVAGIVRYDDYVSGLKLPFLPMTGREDRSEDGASGGKNKQLYNPYIASFMLVDGRQGIADEYDTIREHVVNRAEEITVKDLHLLVPRAIKNQEARYGFWKATLQDVKGPYKKIAEQYLK